MNDLGTALRELAGEAVAPSPVDAGGLWWQGRARVVRRRTSAVLVVAVLALAGYLGTVRPIPHVVMPAGPVHAPAVPENVWAPNKFLAGVSKVGPPGQLAMIGDTESDANHYYGRWFGISATRDRYVRLDLPGLASESPMRLSPDGTRIAYGITGPTKTDSYGPATGVDAGGPLPRRPLTGVAVYDTTTGKVQSYRQLTDFGWASGDHLVMSWLSDRTLEFSYNEAKGANSSLPQGAWTWTPGAGDPTRLTTDKTDGSEYVAGYPPEHLVRVWEGPFVVVDQSGAPTGQRIRMPQPGVGPASVSVSGSTVAYVGPAGTNNISRLQVGQIHGNAQVAFQPVGTSVVGHFLGWRSATSVVIASVPSQVIDGERGIKFDGPGTNKDGIYVADLTTRTEKRVGTINDGVNRYDLQAATSLLGNPMVHGHKPPSVAYALRVPIGIGLAVVVAGLAYVWWRRRHWRRYLARERERAAHV